MPIRCTKPYDLYYVQLKRRMPMPIVCRSTR